MAAFPPEESPDSMAMWPPGTVRLEDMGASSSGDNRIILQPRPTDDPNDPLNWPNWRKYLNFGLVCFWVAMVAEFLNAATPTLGPMNSELGFSYEILNDSYAAGCAALAVGAVVLIPFALKFGRRPLYLFSTVLQFALSVWSAKMQTVADLMLINVLQCGFGALAEVIVQMTIADLFFVHQRGRMNSIYIWIWLIATYLGPLIAGFVAVGQGWRWVWWWNVVFFGVAIFVVGFCYEETKYSPLAALPTFSVDPSPTTEEGHVSNSTPSVKSYDREMDMATTPQEEHVQAKTATSHDIAACDAPPKTATEGSSSLYATTINPHIPRKTYLQKLALTTTSSGGGITSYLCHMYQPLILLTTIPAIAFVALVYGILVGLGDVMSTTLSTYMTQAPYNFTSDQIGLMSLPKMIGVTVGTLIVGPLSDWIVVYLSHRNNGIYEPEKRLWCIVPCLAFVPAGALIFGVGLNNGLPWPVIAVGLALYNVGIAPINSITITYLTDSYQDVSLLFPPLQITGQTLTTSDYRRRFGRRNRCAQLFQHRVHLRLDTVGKRGRHQVRLGYDRLDCLWHFGLLWRLHKVGQELPGW